MSVLSIILLAVAVSIDGFWGGFAYGLRKIRIPTISLIVISFWSYICTMITMLLGHSLVTYLSLNSAKWIGAILLIGIGIYGIKEGLEHKNNVKNEKLNEENVKEKNVINNSQLPLLTSQPAIDMAFRGEVNEKEKATKTNPLILLFKVLGDPLVADMDKSGTISPIEGTILGLAVAMDASIAAFALGIAGINPIITPFLFGFTHFILIGLGNIIATYRTINKLGEKLVYVPGGILIIIGLLRVL